MRKYLIGALFGIALTITSSAFADDIKSLIGMKIQGEFPVTINGLALDKKALVIDGGSYLPVRDMGSALGLDVTFDANMGIKLIKKEVTPVEINTEDHSVSDVVYNPIVSSDKEGVIKSLEEGIYSTQIILKGLETNLSRLDGHEDDPITIKLKENISKTKEAIKNLETRKSDLLKSE